MSDLEDGEISDSSTTEGAQEVEPYEALERPTQPKPVATTVEPDNIDSGPSANEDSSSSDDDGFNRFGTGKRQKKTHIGSSLLSKTFINPLDQARKKRNVWGNVLAEQTLSEEFKGSGLNSLSELDNSRSVESYDYRLAMALHNRRSESEEDDWEPDSYEPPVRQSIQLNDRLSSRKRGRDVLRKRSSQDEKPARILENLQVTLDSPDEDIARDIAKKLYEDKSDLILRVVQTVGKEMAIKLFEETKEVEEMGGIKVLDGSRRRTTGGVFLYLLRKHKEIPMEQIRFVFKEENKVQQQEKKTLQAKRRQKKLQTLRGSVNATDLPTRVELELLKREEDRQLESMDNYVDVTFEDV